MSLPQAPSVSVLIPCYNHAHFLGDAIRSVEACSRNVEIIVVDDGSSDSTHTTAVAFPGVRCMRQPNAGLAAARNRALRESMGEFIVFLDADDQLLPAAIDVGIEALGHHPDCSMAFGRCVMMGPNGEWLPTSRQDRVERDHHAALLRRNLIWTPAMAMFRRAAVESVGGFAPGFDAAADYDLYLRLSRSGPIHDHGRLVAAYRQHGRNMSGDATRMLIETEAVMQVNRPQGNERLLQAWHDGRMQWREFYGTRLVEEIRAHVHAEEWRLAVGKALTLARWHPARALRECYRKARHSGSFARGDAFVQEIIAPACEPEIAEPLDSADAEVRSPSPDRLGSMFGESRT
jgi:glycosyltransferase involved in cell wall biosynthesis